EPRQSLPTSGCGGDLVQGNGINPRERCVVRDESSLVHLIVLRPEIPPNGPAVYENVDAFDLVLVRVGAAETVWTAEDPEHSQWGRRDPCLLENFPKEGVDRSLTGVNEAPR